MTALEAYVARIDEEMRAHLRAADPALAPFYEMMRYHLGLDAEGAPSGKRLRPLVALLLTEALTGEADVALPVAAALELLHNFTLVHDDIEDQDRTRRHRPTVWSVWGVAQAINAGDGMYALSRVAVQRLRARGVAPEPVLDATALLDRACLLVCEGQYLDISFESRTDVTVERYHAMVARKTGALFEASAEIPGVLAGADAALRERLRAFGAHFGAAFQAHDDRDGVWGAAARTGKAEMNDIAKRKMSLPLVRAFSLADAEQRAALGAAYAGAAPLPADEVLRVRRVLDALDVRAWVERFADAERGLALAALEGLPLRAGPRDALRALVAEAAGG